MSRPVLVLFSLLSCLAPALPAEDSVQLVRVWPGYRDAASFTRLGEYFGAAPDAANQSALRSQPAARDGYYWLVRTQTPRAHPGATLSLKVMRAGAAAPELHRFTLDVPAGSHALQAGLTGRDWPDPAERPVAWQLTLTAADGSALAATQSFLWADPPPSS